MFFPFHFLLSWPISFHLSRNITCNWLFYTMGNILFCFQISALKTSNCSNVVSVKKLHLHFVKWKVLSLFTSIFITTNGQVYIFCYKLSGHSLAMLSPDFSTEFLLSLSEVKESHSILLTTGVGTQSLRIRKTQKSTCIVSALCWYWVHLEKYFI